ncbi:MAG: hypothetical protein FWH39_01730 [Bacteroidales bacterium]|nr:hypothetical protein [Bacteroidales bacterium]
MEQEKELTVGTQVEHERFGTGFVFRTSLMNYEIIFERGGRMSFPKTTAMVEMQVASEVVEDENPKQLSLAEVEQALTYILEKHNGLEQEVELGDRWQGGTMILKPSNDSLPKEISIEAFFHKIVMVRDRLRVLEQNINSHKKLTDEDKVNLQQYISRIYGSLTTFNVLFKEKNSYFVGTGGGE